MRFTGFRKIENLPTGDFRKKCKGKWKRKVIDYGWVWQCTRCGMRLSGRDGDNAVNHRDQ